jgi:perosamine synthetase
MIMDHMIPLAIPNFEGNERKYVDDAVDQGWVSTGGAYITRLEKQTDDFLGAPAVSACQSGTSALHLSLIDIGVAPGDMVIVPTLTFIAAVNPVKYCYADPIFMDCDDSLCMDPVKLRKFLETECEKNSSGQPIYRKTGQTVKAIVVVHVFGNLADMEQICDIAAEYGLKVVEDATEALGSKYTSSRFAGRYAGTLGDYGAYSFNGNKIITTGGGGAVTAKDPEAVKHLRYLSTQAKDDPHYYIHNEIGYNYRMTNVQAALGVAQMEELPSFIERKQKGYALYEELLAGFENARLIPFREGTESNKWFYSLLIDRDKVKAPIREIISELEARKIQTRAIWGLIHEQRPYAGSIVYEMEKAPYYSERVINLPCSTQITEKEIRYVAKTVKEVLK